MRYKGIYALAAGLSAIGATFALSRARRAKRGLLNHHVEQSFEGHRQPYREIRTGILEPLTVPDLARRTSDLYRDGYVSITGIIQGVALGFLLSAVGERWHQNLALSNKVMIVTQSLSVFVTIVTVTHRYLLLTVIGRWVPTSFDTFIPFALGVGEIGMALVIGKSSLWWATVAMFSVASVITFVHSRARSTAAAFGEVPQLYVRFRRITLLGIVMLSSLALVGICLCVLSSNRIGSGWFYAIMPLVCSAVSFVFDALGNYRISSLQ